MPSFRLVAVGVLSSYALALILIIFLALADIHWLPGWGSFEFLLLLAVVTLAGLLATLRAGIQAMRGFEAQGKYEWVRDSYWVLVAYSLFLPLLALVVLNTWLAWQGGGAAGASVAVAADPYRYGAVIDAGSSGSRIAIFEWRIAGNGDPHVWPVLSVEGKDAEGKNCPLSDLPKDQDRICNCLRTLTSVAREAAMRYLGEPDLPPIDLWVKATAGVRYQKPATRAVVLEATDRCLGDSAHYDWRAAEVISGEEEGMYAWLAVNHVARTLRNDRPDTFGIVEVGGMSAQIAYRVPGRTSPAPEKGEILQVPLASGTLHIYSLSDKLGKNAAWGGIDAAGQRHCELNGDRDMCLSAIDDYLCRTGFASRACPQREFERRPPRDLRFVGLSNFTHVTRNMGLASQTLEEVRARAEMICGSFYDDDRRSELLKAAGKYKDYVCFDSLYATQLARDGWGVALEAVSPPDPQWATDPSWPLGAMIFEALHSTNSGAR
jgi:hypothetical protein